MLVRPVVFDATMTALEALTRLARHGLWHSPTHRGALGYLQKQATRLGIPVEKVAERLRADPARQYVTIRREWRGNVLWYARPVPLVLDRCLASNDDEPLLHALQLQEGDSTPPVEVASLASNRAPLPEDGRVVVERGEPVAVSVPAPAELVGRGLPEVPWMSTGSEATFRYRESRGADYNRTASVQPAPAAGVRPDKVRSRLPEHVEAWPRLEAPEFAPALQPFDVVVGLSDRAQEKTIGGRMTFKVPDGARELDINVELTCTGADCADGWSRMLRVPVSDPGSVSVTFQLRGHEPPGEEQLHLTMLEVRYVLNGTVCGTASRALAIGASTASQPPALPPNAPGTPWLSTPPAATRIDFSNDAPVADLTIEIVKADKNARGIYSCWLRSPHGLKTPAGPHGIDLGDDARTFASSVVSLVRAMSGDVLIANALDSVGDLVAEKLPRAAVNALREVALATQPNPPTVLLVSADPYVPWELAKIDPPLDASRPPFLGAQAVMGRWLRMSPPSSVEALTAAASSGAERPPLNPPASIDVRHMAVMAGLYKPPSGLRSLPHAEQEAKDLVLSHRAILLAASPQSLAQLLGARLEHNFDAIGGADAVHFAGHGQFDPGEVDASVLYLSNGKPMSSLLFRSAKYGPPNANQPLIFLNACMIGIGAELLGDMGGFPGNCLRGGFGGLLGALWEVDDDLARDIALEFWERALPVNGNAPEPVGEILRDLRARYGSQQGAPPLATYLSYVYYGHPRLRLQRLP